MKTECLSGLLVALALVGCGDISEYREQVDRVVCSLDGKAYLIGDGIGVRLTVKRSPQFDMLCAPMKKSSASIGESLKDPE